LNESDRRLRFGSCKRSPGKLIADVNNFKGHVARFLDTFREYQDWQIEHVAIAPRLADEHRRILTQPSPKFQSTHCRFLLNLVFAQGGRELFFTTSDNIDCL